MGEGLGAFLHDRVLRSFCGCFVGLVLLSRLVYRTSLLCACLSDLLPLYGSISLLYLLLVLVLLFTVLWLLATVMIVAFFFFVIYWYVVYFAYLVPYLFMLLAWAPFPFGMLAFF